MATPEKVAGFRRKAVIAKRYYHQGTGILAAEVAKARAESQLEEATRLSFHIQRIYEELVLALMQGDTHTVMGRTADPERLPLVMEKRKELNQVKAKARKDVKVSTTFFDHVFTRRNIEQLSKDYHRALDNDGVGNTFSYSTEPLNEGAAGKHLPRPIQGSC